MNILENSHHSIFLVCYIIGFQSQFLWYDNDDILIIKAIIFNSRCIKFIGTQKLLSDFSSIGVDTWNFNTQSSQMNRKTELLDESKIWVVQQQSVCMCVCEGLGGVNSVKKTNRQNSNQEVVRMN